MNCPACKSKLDSQVVANVTLDVCSSGCGGIWFDQFEFKKFDENHEPNPDAQIRLNLPAKPPVKLTELFGCPRCPDTRIRMQRHFSSPKRAVTIDECPKCAGIWLDMGELAQIRTEYKSEAERIKAAETMVEELFGERMKAEAAKTQESLKSNEQFARAFRFICPSFYIPGKQTGGAF